MRRSRREKRISPDDASVESFVHMSISSCRVTRVIVRALVRVRTYSAGTPAQTRGGT